MPLPVTAVNELTARWAANLDDGPNVLSGLGIWPLLALLRLGADDTTAAELDSALGAEASAGPELLEVLERSEAVRAALGLWSKPGLPIEPAWAQAVPVPAWAQLTGDEATDRAALDEWARANTGGLIERMPVASLSCVRLLLASAIAIRTQWEQRFAESPWRIEDGPWAGRTVAGLERSGRELDQVRVARTDTGPLTLLTCRGREDVDVILALGTGGPAEVLAAALRAPEGTPGSRLEDGTPGPGLQIGELASIDAPTLTVHTARFTVTGGHDLSEQQDLFGLRSAMDESTGHFPRISSDPLYVGSARQDAIALFTAQGFEAAAVSSVTFRPTAFRRPSAQAFRQITCTLDRPFGFLALHRPTGLVLVAGWVSEPEPG